MEAGRLRQRVTIETESRAPNGQGGYRTAWTAIAEKVSAEIVAQSGTEALKLNAERSATQYRVSIRKRAGLTAKHRLQWKGQVMAIHSVQPHPKFPDSHQLLLCEIGFGS